MIDERGSYAYVHCVHDELRDSGKTPYGPSDNDEGSLAHADQKIVHRMPKSHRKVDGNWVPATENDKATPLVLPLQSIIGPCLAVPDLMCKNYYLNKYLMLRPVHEWGDYLAKEAVQHREKSTAAG